jgi:hypothetical protein
MRDIIYTTWGPVRGCCGHRHTSLLRAGLCCAADRKRCKDLGRYSDRSVRRLRADMSIWRFTPTQGPGSALSADEAEHLYAEGINAS